MQVGVKSQFQGSQGQLMFFFGNKGDAALERLIFVIPPAGQFAFQQGAVPPLLEPKKQIQVCFLLPTHSPTAVNSCNSSNFCKGRLPR